MTLSELTTGKEAHITGITGNGAIRRRINEMGFIVGRKVKAIKAAPLKDPVEYEVMGYKLTIRQKDAGMITVEPAIGLSKDKQSYKYQNGLLEDSRYIKSPDEIFYSDSNTINVALVGNPNCGKTTIFNFATNSRERVANYSGVTVAAKEARFKIDGYNINVIDLPGTYSLSSYSPEEMFVTDYLLYNRPDLVINVLDSGNLERNLFLTTQLIDTGLKTIIALNMFDELQASKGDLDYLILGKLLGIPFIPTIGTKGKGLNELFKTVITVFKNQDESIRQIQIPYGKEIEEAIALIFDELLHIQNKIPTPNRFLALQLLEADPFILSAIPKENREKLFKLCRDNCDAIESILSHDINTEIVNFRYGFIQGALLETFIKKDDSKTTVSQKIDSVLTHKFWGLPVFFSIILFMFYCTFKLGEIPMTWMDNLIGWISGIVGNKLPESVFNNLLVDGIIGGVGGVIVFLPNIIILFFFISIMEDSGYMARTAFLMDKLMHKAGLHGKSFIPLLMGFGCNVPAILASRTIESKRDRLVTMFITPFMSCSARLPVYVLFISAFFPLFESLILFLIYAIGILAALVTAIILNKTIFRKTESPFVMELPPYRLPTFKAVSKHTWFKTTHFLKKMGTVILMASIVIWALGYFPQDDLIIAKYDNEIEKQQESLTQFKNGNITDIVAIENRISQLEILKHSELLEQSYISRIGKTIQPFFAPLGFDWKMSVSILTGIMAKEVVVSSMGILYHVGSDLDEKSDSLINKLRLSRQSNNTHLITYFGFLVFTLLYFPCMGTLIAIKKETAKYKWTVFSALYPFLFAWIITFIIYQSGSWF
jgi:ferrous iron transport protein B